MLLTPASLSSTTNKLHWKHLQSWRAYMHFTSQAPLFKHYRIQSSLLALNNPRCLLAHITGVQPQRGYQAFLRWASSLVPRMAAHRQELAERAWQGLCSSLPCKPQVPWGTALLYRKVPMQGTSAATATLAPKVHFCLHPATSLAMCKSHLFLQMSQWQENIDLAENTEGSGEKRLKVFHNEQRQFIPTAFAFC